MLSRKIIYFAFVSPSYGGVEQKIISQYDALQALGVNVDLYLISPNDLENDFQLACDQRHSIYRFISSKEKVKNPLFRRIEKFEYILTQLQQYNPTEAIIYFRYPAADWFFYQYIRKIKDLNFKIVTEHQNIENVYRIGKLNGSLKVALFDFLYGAKIRKLIDGFVGVTDQYTDIQLSYLKNKDNKKTLTNGNGINVSKIPVRTSSIFDGKTLKILFVGAGFKTRGLHRLIKSLHAYQKRSSPINIVIHVVGNSHEMKHNMKLVEKLRLEHLFVFHGQKRFGQYDDIYNECHIAMSCLCLCRIGNTSSSALKIREYCARGIPFFYSTPDVDIPVDFPYHLLLPDGEEIFDIDLLVNFATKMNATANATEQIRSFAIQNLDWKVKMKKLATFLQTVD